jgi:hypothetical protein
MPHLIERLCSQPDLSMDDFLRFATVDAVPETVAYRATLAVGAWHAARSFSLRNRRPE